MHKLTITTLVLVSPSFDVDKAKGSLNSPFIYRDKGDVEEEHSLFCPPSEAGVGVFHKVRM